MSHKLTCVTGASGFIGSHLVKTLLEQGYTVRATVRDADSEQKTAHLKALSGSDRLTLHSADLMVEGAFDDIIAGCQSVFHVASAVYLTADDPQREIVEPAVQGTKNVFSAIEKSGTVTSVGLTSSIAAILNAKPRPDHRYTEADWIEDASLETAPYPLSKRLAEEAAWAAHAALDEERRYSLSVVNPVLVTGPVMARVHVRSSPAVIRDIMRGSFKRCPNLGFGLVDVRDVVQALLVGVEGGHTGRYILHNRFMWMREIAALIAQSYPDRKVPTHRLPNLLMYLAAFFDKRLTWSFLRRNLNVKNNIDNQKVQRELGLKLTPLDASIRETCESFIALRLV